MKLFTGASCAAPLSNPNYHIFEYTHSLRQEYKWYLITHMYDT